METRIAVVVITSILWSNVWSQTCQNFFVSVSHDGTQLYFSSDRHNPGGNFEIYKSGLDGVSDLERLTVTSTDNFLPRESPDGSKVVWQVGSYGDNTEIWIMDSDGSNAVQLTNNSVYDGNASFSPDGQKIVFDAWDETPYPEIFTMIYDGSSRTQITNEGGAYWNSAPVFHPSGMSIYFNRGFNADNRISKMDPDGSNIVDITPMNSFGYAESSVSFSPDGNQIAFHTSENTGYNNGSELVIADASGENWTFLSASVDGDYFTSPQWHPSNNKIYYNYYAPNGSGFWEVYEMDTDGSDINLLLDCTMVTISENSPSLYGFYPNPTDGKVKLRLERGMQAEVSALDGRALIVVSGEYADLSALPAGVYLVSFIRENGSFAGRERLVKH